MSKIYEVWVEITANKNTILCADKFEKTMEKCKASGMTGIILSVKDTTGFSIYPSEIVPHYSLYDPDFQSYYDYVSQCFRIIREKGMKCYAAFDIFAGGNRIHTHEMMPGICNPDFACEVYGLDESGNVTIKNSTEALELHTVGSIDDFGEIFLNPGNAKVREYAISMIMEFIEKYHPDGIVLDRVRYVGLSTDFSELSRIQWEEYADVTDENWPEDIYTIEKTTQGYKEKPGKYFGSFITYRMQIIHDFMVELRKRIYEKYTDIEFCDYTGSWYPLYYQVGANWASTGYEAKEFPWCDDGRLKESSYAEQLDTLLSGCYYEEITIEEAHKNHRPADWYSVEGASNLARKVAGDGVRIVDSLFLDQYRDDPKKISRAIETCMKKSEGCMLFDLSYIVEENWWQYVEAVKIEALLETDLKEVATISAQVFQEEYGVTEQKLKMNLFAQADYDPQASYSLRTLKEGKMIGFIGVKTSDNQELYPDTAWISILGILPDYQRRGYGTLLLKRTLEVLKEKGIKKIFIGQDFSNFFSGIPNPNLDKKSFFEKMNFTLNSEDHYDLEGNIIANKTIEQFDETPWSDFLYTRSYQGEYEKFLTFLKQEFPGRWEYEAEEMIKKGKDFQEILLLWNHEYSEVLGFCMLHAEKNENGEKSGYGGLGPIGISKKLRGNHVGDFILCRSLKQLNMLGVKTVNIDWTILRKFYEQFDFSVVRTYCAGYLLIENISK